MDRHLFSTIAHRDHTFFSPISPAKADRLISLIPLTPDDHALDVGCGQGEMLIRLCEATGAHGTGIDINATFIKQAAENAQGRTDRITWRKTPIAKAELGVESFAAALCIGATQAFGGYLPTLRALSACVKPGGTILIGEGYWKQPPPQEYLDFLGANADDYAPHAETFSKGAEAGLRPLYAAVSNQDEWDHYEGLYARAVEQYIYHNPTDRNRTRLKTRITAWREAYYRWGRATLGFGWYLFLRP